MKIIILTESLGSGGAERQACTLAVEMKGRGHGVKVVSYAPGDFFFPMLEQHGVEHIFLGGTGTRQWLPRIRRFLRRSHQDVVVAFQGTCASYAEIASLPTRPWGLVVSERSAFPGMFKGTGYLRKGLHLLADAVITNSHSNRIMLENKIPWLKGKIITIYNTIDHNTFKYIGTPPDKGYVQIVAASRIGNEKNILGLIKAVSLLKGQTNGHSVVVDIYGSPESNSNYLQKCLDLIRNLELHDYIRINGVRDNIAAIYQNADAVLLPSYYEGLPNTICEAMACGKPILLSGVCDASNLVIQGQNGFMFDPHNPEAIAAAISTFAGLPPSARHEMGLRSRRMAEKLFDSQKIMSIFEKVLLQAAERQVSSVDHWPPEVPDTAL